LFTSQAYDASLPGLRSTILYFDSQSVNRTTIYIFKLAGKKGESGESGGVCKKDEGDTGGSAGKKKAQKHH